MSGASAALQRRQDAANVVSEEQRLAGGRAREALADDDLALRHVGPRHGSGTDVNRENGANGTQCR